MGAVRTDEFRRNAVRTALTGGLSRRQVADDLGVGLSTLNKLVNAYRDTDVVFVEDRELARENGRLRREIRILEEDRDIPKRDKEDEKTIRWIVYPTASSSRAQSCEVPVRRRSARVSASRTASRRNSGVGLFSVPKEPLLVPQLVLSTFPGQVHVRSILLAGLWQQLEQ